ncbi:MAG: trehalose-phosphatase [Actinomycetota bacterium]|nr:trehalose-phosphatase [Actinomycetota bacterium]
MSDYDHRLTPWLESPGSAGVLTDFDGTLSPIVDDPEAAWPLPGVADTLARLAQRYPTVAVISGRPVQYLIDRLGPPPGVTLAGLYGLEKGERDGVQVLPEADRWRQTVDEVASAAENESPDGVYVERKGLAVGLHVRQAPQHADWIAAWADQRASRTGLVVHPAKMSVELRPPVETDKGVVVADLAEGLKAVCYLGDDVGDLSAFAALAQMRAHGVDTLSIAVRSEESPPELLEQADIVVDGPEGALAFLHRLTA